MLQYEDRPQMSESIIIARWNNNKISLEQNGLKTIRNFNQGQIHLLCLQNFFQKNYQLLGKSRRTQGSIDNCMLVRTSPIYYGRTNKNILIIEIQASNPVAKQQLHLLASIISNIIIVPLGTQDNTAFLGTVGRRTNNPNSYARKNSRGGVRDGSKIASLVCLMPNMMEKGEFIRDQTGKLMGKFQADGVLNDVITSYPLIKGLECPELSLFDPSQNFRQKMLQQIDISSQNTKQNSELMFGPILTKLTQNIVTQMNENPSGILDLNRAQDDIRIDQGYEAYMAGVERYHKVGLDLIDKNSRPDDNQLQEMLTIAKVKAFDQFYLHEGSHNAEYKRMLEDYITNKNYTVIGTYSGQQWNKNLQILQSESKSVLDRISASRVKDPAVIMNYIDEMTRNYEQNARGPQKYEILNDYMKVFTPVALEDDPERQARLRQELRRNQELQARINELKKQKSGCCGGKCSIM